MDPISTISLVASCAGLAKTCVSVSKTLTDLAEKYKHAELTLLSIAEECDIIQVAWIQIERWASHTADRIDDYEYLYARLEKSVYTGELIMSALETDLHCLQRSGNLLRRTKVVWNDNAIRDHQHRLRGQVCALTLLLEAIQL